MPYSNSGDILSEILEKNGSKEEKQWIFDKIDLIVQELSVKKFYMAYTHCASKVEKRVLDFKGFDENKTVAHLKEKGANTLELARTFMLVRILESNFDFFEDKVRNIIGIADTSELETLLKYLVLLPNAGNFKFAAVEALRTNIATIFDAIAMNNPYPALYFNAQQWNQMYLKAAFMQRDLSQIVDVDKMANKELARIISDYAHERWAASRTIDPEFWRPVSNFLEGQTLEDMVRLFESDNPIERNAAALVCYHSDKSEAKELLDGYPSLRNEIEKESLTWKTLKR